MDIPSEVAGLVERFQRNRDSYRSPQYNEAQLRQEFLDPMFKALGWDVDNEAGYAEAYKDVIHEDSIRVGGIAKAPDYCFRIGGARKFFLEAKKPAVNIKQDTTPAFQLRRGECLGLIGHNGAGKTTLLRILNGLIRPDKGKITIRGRVGALIALGTGFNPILTGRENVFAAGAILGFTTSEIRDRYQAIVDFAEIHDFMDTPVMNYSTRMQMRLGFAVATQMNGTIMG